MHDVTSVKYNKENEIFSDQLTCFTRLNKKSVKTENEEHKFAWESLRFEKCQNWD